MIKLIGLAIIALAGLVGCSTTAATDPMAEVWFTPSDVETTGLPMYASKVAIPNMYPGAKVDTLTQDETSPERPSYSLEKGSPVGVNVHNPGIDPVTVFVSFVATPGMTIDKETELEYSPTPGKAKEWVTIAGS